MAERHITLVRHGQHERPSGNLTELGFHQAVYTAQALAEYPVTNLYSSPQRRAVQTADILADTLDIDVVEQTPVLSEAVPIIPRSHQEHFAQFPDLTPGKVAAHRVRVAYAYQQHFRPTAWDDVEHDVLVCHGNIIRYFVCRALGASLGLWVNMEIYNASISRIRVEPDGTVRLVSHNDVGHLPRDLWTSV